MVLAEQREEAVREALHMAGGQPRRGGAQGVHQARVLLEDLVGLVAVADPEPVRRLRQPSGRGGGAGDFPAERVLAPEADLAHRHRPPGAAGIAQQDQRRVLGRDPHRLGRAAGLREGLDGAEGTPPLGDEGGQLGEDRRGPHPGDEARQVEPVGADVAHRPRRPAGRGLQAPVPVGVAGQPVLMVVPGDQPDVAQGPAGDHAPGLLVQRREAEVVADGRDSAAAARQRGQLARFGRGHRQGLLADDVAAGGQDPLHLRVVEMGWMPSPSACASDTASLAHRDAVRGDRHPPHLQH